MAMGCGLGPKAGPLLFILFPFFEIIIRFKILEIRLNI
jgi:hypothetical protein